MKKRIIILLTILLIFSLSGCKKAVKSISLDKNTITIGQEQNFTLNATILPSDADNKELAWSINGDSVRALTDENSAKKEFIGDKTGTSTITVTASNGYTAECVVNVEKEEENDTQKTEQKEVAESNAANESNKENSQYLISGNVNIKLKNTVPATIKEFSSIDGSIVRSYKITKVQADGNGIYVSGTKLSDKFSNEFGCKIKWQLYDDRGAVVTSDWKLSPATAVGESWANVNIRFNASSLPAGVYTLQFCDSD